jgi:uncharacterized protein YnzC (UPF0291/DUF896 family)
MALVKIDMWVNERYAETAKAYVMEHVEIQERERLEKEALSPVQDAIEEALEEMRVANAPETPAEPEPQPE